ncbi:hypothetical protein WQ54_03280 [Bacillus sp. SA1-12]|uniref:hypothetical protein n=1 Tax=Bacillus sp. SA1-12 TaxID=1455638 RepID=UPI0006257BA7|nr:hypothetical protein [Bacillus sp. SA1-12]KKI93645.1 hypothetical protein WQ54_03280 [Bacillus sp. SA1-12]
MNEKKGKQKVKNIKQNDNKASINTSGNSNVDISIDIDTRAIAYAVLCSLYATDKLNESQFQKALEKFESVMKTNANKNGHNQPNVIELPKQRRTWI